MPSFRFLNRKGKQDWSSSSLNSASSSNVATATRHNESNGDDEDSPNKPSTVSSSMTKSQFVRKNSNNVNENGTNSTNDKSQNKKQNAIYKVKIPQNARPGQEFQVTIKSRVVTVKVPPNGRPGQYLQITVPLQSQLNIPINPPTNNNHPRPQKYAEDSPNVQRIQRHRQQAGEHMNADEEEEVAYMVTIPSNIQPGESFTIIVNGQELIVTCPPKAQPGMQVRIVPPPSSTTQNLQKDNANTSHREGEAFDVIVPNGVEPGTPFALLANGIRVTVTCPLNASSGQKIRFHLPQQIMQIYNDMNRNSKRGKKRMQKLEYDVGGGWARTVNLSNAKFQWVRCGAKQKQKHYDKGHEILQKALVRKVTSEHVILVPAHHAFVDSSITTITTKNDNDKRRELASCSDILSIQAKPLEDKLSWFKSICSKLHDVSKSAVHISICRDNLLEESMTTVLSMSPEELHRTWRFCFVNEVGVDAGGLRREWFHLVSTTLLDVASGCWKSCSSGEGSNQMQLQIHPLYAISCSSEEYKFYFRFLGRVMGKALIDSQIISNGHFVPYLYKMILGWPITFTDLQALDVGYYKSLLQLMEMEDDSIEYACLDFTVVEDIMGNVQVVELKPGGKDIDVTKDNLEEYLELVLQYRLVKRVEEPLKELLTGFYDMVPENLLTIFDYQELELVLCGVPNIDVMDWKLNTVYSGLFDDLGDVHPICVWFWEVVEDMTQERRARLLQFVTGTSGVPANGFGVLQGNDGDIRRFTIHGVELNECLFPRAHTCFNRIDLPNYKSKEDLLEKVEIAITLVSTGFDLE